jgi:hypothetical protein
MATLATASEPAPPLTLKLPEALARSGNTGNSSDIYFIIQAVGLP